MFNSALRDFCTNGLCFKTTRTGILSSEHQLVNWQQNKFVVDFFFQVIQRGEVQEELKAPLCL